MRSVAEILDGSGYPTYRTVFRDSILKAMERALLEQKIDFYKKLEHKIANIINGQINIEDYQISIDVKIEKLENQLTKDYEEPT